MTSISLKMLAMTWNLFSEKLKLSSSVERKKLSNDWKNGASEPSVH